VAIATLIIVAVLIVLLIRSRGDGGEDKRPPKNNGGTPFKPADPSASLPLNKHSDEILDVDDKNPDVIPVNSGNFLKQLAYNKYPCACLYVSCILIVT